MPAMRETSCGENCMHSAMRPFNILFLHKMGFSCYDILLYLHSLCCWDAGWQRCEEGHLPLPLWRQVLMWARLHCSTHRPCGADRGDQSLRHSCLHVVHEHEGGQDNTNWTTWKITTLATSNAAMWYNWYKDITTKRKCALHTELSLYWLSGLRALFLEYSLVFTLRFVNEME